MGVYTSQDDTLIVEISDSGPGFDVVSTAVSNRLGLVGMRERVELLGGQFELHSALGHGTTIRTHLPLSVHEVEDV
ncbi:MAG: ATP-binding protein [Chloroflexota bacterium]